MPSGVGEIMILRCALTCPRSSPSTLGRAIALALTYSESCRGHCVGRGDGRGQCRELAKVSSVDSQLLGQRPTLFQVFFL